MEPLSISFVENPNNPARSRWSVHRGEHTVATFATIEDAKEFISILRKPGETPRPIPLVLGGQDRSADDVIPSRAGVAAVAGVALFSCAAWAAIAWLCGWI